MRLTEVVFVPTFKRPEFLVCCLEAIREAEPTIDIVVSPDRGTDETEICERFSAVQRKTIPHQLHGNTYNMMSGLKELYGQGRGAVFVIEDDCIVDRSFFDWCRKALTRYPDAFAACGWQYSPDAIVGDGPDIQIPWYLSVCSAIPRKSLAGIVQHAREEYYLDMPGYLDRTYPNSYRRGTLHFEQDGAILRTCESESKRCVWPRRPRATHVGFRGYHMPDGKDTKGTLEERVELVKMAAKDPSLLQRLMAGAEPPDMGHCEKCQRPLLSENKEARTVCVSCFHQEFPNLPVTTKSHYYLKGESHA